MSIRSIRRKLKFAGRLKQKRSDFFDPTLQKKTLLLIFLLVAVLFTTAGCDFLQDEKGEVYDLPVKVEVEEPAMLEQADLREMEVELGSSSISGSRYNFWREDEAIKGRIKDLQDRVTVNIKHPLLGGAGRRVGPDHAGSETVFTMPGIETRLEFDVEQLPLHKFINIPGEEDLYFYRLSLHDELEQLERLAWVETAVFLDGADEILTEKKMNHDFYLLADSATEDQVAEAELALLNEDRIIQARGEFSVSERDLQSASEDEPDLIVHLDYDRGQQLSTASALQTRNYLNRIKLYDGEDILVEHRSDTDEVIFENFSHYDRGIELDEDDLMTDGLPGSYLTVAGVITDLDDLLQDDGGQAFRDMVSSKMEKHNHQFEEMDLFVKLDNTDHRELLDLGAADAGDVWSTLEEILTEIDGMWRRQNYGGLEFTYDMGTIVEGEAEITYFDVVVEEVYGYQDARGFTLGDDSGYTNTSQEFGEVLTQTTDPDNGEMYIYALGSAPDGYNPGPHYVSSADELYETLREEPQARVILTQDIDMNNLSYDSWIPVGSSSRAFQGTLDGNMYEIDNLTIADDGGDAGLFRYLGDEGRVEDLYLRDVDVSGRNYVGAVAGRSEGTIKNVRMISGQISGLEYVGGLTGKNLAGGRLVDNSFGIFVEEADDEDEEGLGIRVSVDYDYAGSLTGVNRGQVGFSIVQRDQLYDEGYIDRLDDPIMEINLVHSRERGNNIGGLVGYNSGESTTGDNGEIDMSGLKAGADLVVGGREVGGIAGRNSGRIIDSWFVSYHDDFLIPGDFVDLPELPEGWQDLDRIGNVIGTGDNVGGIVGLHEFIDEPGDSRLENVRVGTEDNDYIEDVPVRVYGQNSVGGLVGESWADIEWNDQAENIMSHFAVHGSHYNVGGVIGHLNYGEIRFNDTVKELISGSDVSSDQTGRYGRVMGRIDDREAEYVIDVDEDIDHTGFNVRFDLSEEPENPRASDPYNNVGYGPSPWDR